MYKCTHMHSCMCVHECEFMDPEHTIIIYLCRGEFKRTASSSSALFLLLLLLLYYYNKYNIIYRVFRLHERNRTLDKAHPVWLFSIRFRQYLSVRSREIHE